jgi:hypothetical protein
MTSYEEYNGTDIIKEFLKSSVDPVDIELKSKEMIDSCITIINKYKLHDGKTRPLRRIQDIYIDFKYIIQDRSSDTSGVCSKGASPSSKINNFCNKIKELNQDVQEKIINIINKYNKILEEIIEDPRLYLEKNKISQKSKQTSKMICPSCLKEVFIYSYETTHKGSKKCEYYQTHKVKRQPNDKIKCCDLCDYTQTYSHTSRMNKHRLHCEAYLSCLISEGVKKIASMKQTPEVSKENNS